MMTAPEHQFILFAINNPDLRIAVSAKRLRSAPAKAPYNG
jgi:hypothetical protein